MSDIKHTWKADGKDIRNASGLVIAQTKGQFDLPGGLRECEANARLIAASPNMLEVLEVIHEDGGMARHIHEQIQAILDRIKGEQC